MLIDEADRAASNNEQLQGILNASHKRASATVPRCEGVGTLPAEGGVIEVQKCRSAGKVRTNRIFCESICAKDNPAGCNQRIQVAPTLQRFLHFCTLREGARWKPSKVLLSTDDRCELATKAWFGLALLRRFVH